MRPPGCINPPGCVSDYENPVSDCENPVSDCVLMWRIWTWYICYHLRVVSFDCYDTFACLIHLLSFACCIIWLLWYTAWRRDTSAIICVLYHLYAGIVYAGNLLWYNVYCALELMDTAVHWRVLSLRGGVILIVEAWYNTSIYCCNDTLVFLLLYNSYAATILWYPFIYCCALVSIYILLCVGIHLYTTACLKTVHYPLRAWRLFTALVLRLVHCVLEDCSQLYGLLFL